MRLIFISNYYPPAARGGYELWCQEIAGEFVKRGHEVCVLTTRATGHGDRLNGPGISVHRTLNLEVEGGLASTILHLLIRRKQVESENLDQVKQLVAGFRPDLALMWGMWNLPRSIPALIEELLPGRVIYYISDYWPSLPSAHLQRLQAPSRRWATRLPKRLLSLSVLAQLEKEPPIDLAMERPICVSRTVKEELMLSGVPVGHAKILPGGIDVNEFIQTRKIERWENGDQFSLLYAGRIEPEKGVHLVIQALGILAQRHEPPMVKLDIVGEGNPDYEEELKNAVIKGGLDRTVAFRGWVPRSRMPAVMANHDALVFPSRWKEPFGRSMVEAMAAGLAVLGTTTGGTAEILLDGKTGLTFPPGDANAMASQIQRLASDPSRGSELAEAGRRHVLEHFTLRRMADGIEAAVRSAVKGEAF